MKRVISLLLLIFFFCIGATFSYFNPEQVRVDYLFGEFELPLGLVLVAVLGCTLIFTLLCAWLFSVAQRTELRRLRKRLNAADAELRNLRSLPLKNS